MIGLNHCPEWVPGTPLPEDMRHAELERRFQDAVQRFWSVDSHRELMRRLAAL